MHDTLQVQFTALGKEISTVAISSECKRTVAWCIEQLPDLYSKFIQTTESRYIQEITRLVQGVMKELTENKTGGPAAHKLAVSISQQFNSLHEQLGLPKLILKSLVVPAPRSRKAS